MMCGTASAAGGDGLFASTDTAPSTGSSVTSVKPKRRRKPDPTAALMRWNPECCSFDGCRNGLRKKIHERYLAEFGKDWIDATWACILEWCEDNPDRIAKRKSHYRVILNWYRREAMKLRNGHALS